MPNFPSVLANSLPRGGPFLLTSTLEVLGYQKYAGAEVNNTPAAFNYLEAKKALNGRLTSDGDGMIAISPFAPCYVEQALMHKWLGKLSADEYIMAHIPYAPALPAALEGLNCRHIAIIRDPRSLLLSLLFDTHPMPRFLIEPFGSMSAKEQLAFMVSGGDVPKVGMRLLGFADMYRSMCAWQKVSDCLVVRFEDLAGPDAGGNIQRQKTALQAIANHLDIPFDESVYTRLDKIHDPSLDTFRLDQKEQWENVVSRELVESVVDVCEDLAKEAGYNGLMESA